LALSASYFYGNITQPTKIVTQPINTAANPNPKVTVAATEIDAPPSKPTGKIVYTCELEGAEICLVNSDGTGWQRLTNSSQASFNASLTPDGQSVVYVTGKGDQTEVYELKLDNGDIKQLTKLGKYITTPEISPDNYHILFTYRSGNNNQQIWIMNRDGSEPHLLFSSAGKDAHDPTWSPDSSRILFALGRGENNKLYIMDRNGHDPQLVSPRSADPGYGRALQARNLCHESEWKRFAPDLPGRQQFTGREFLSKRRVDRIQRLY